MIEDVNIVQSHAAEALVEARHKIFAGAPVSVRPRPHIIARFCGNNHFITVRAQVGGEDSPEILLGGAVARAVVVCQIEMGNAGVKCFK